ncbi:MAG: hypothetical protein KGL39_35130 [Patescibacteria group bacterium]|nr:hypothetical protein [Patescibacteria group bacterium]
MQALEASRVGGRRIIPDYDFTATSLGNNNVYTVVTYTRPDGTQFMVSTLSNPNGGGWYQTDIWQFYDPTGVTMIETVTWTVAYDSSGNIISAVMS